MYEFIITMIAIALTVIHINARIAYAIERKRLLVRAVSAEAALRGIMYCRIPQLKQRMETVNR